MEMKYPKSYNKINNSSYKLSNNYKNIKKWYVTEKIHGANFSFVYEVNTNTMKHAKRTGFIEQDENFFNYTAILQETEPKIMNIIEYIKTDYENLKSIIIYGELFGGLYPNIKSKFKPVQKEIYYSPNLHFIAFDIYISFQNNISYYLNFTKSIEYFKLSNIMYTEPIAICSTYEEAYNYEIGFNTSIPIKLNLPELNINKAEGIIIRGDDETNKKYIIKKKIPEFSETKYSNSKINPNDKKTIGLNMITENRLNNAISKIGSLEENRYQIYDLIVQDILTELNISNSTKKTKLKNIFMKNIEELFD